MKRKPNEPAPEMVEVDQPQLDELLAHAEAAQALSQDECRAS